MQPNFDWVSTPSLALLTPSLILAYIISTIIYRLHFHPLANYPGPVLARISTFPSYYHTLKQDRHIWLWRLQQQYGHTFRYRPDAVLINTPTAFRSIFGPKGNVRKSDYYRVWPRTAEITSTWNVTDAPAHARKRRVMNQAFSERALRSAEGFIHENLDRWLDLLAGRSGRSINMAHEINYLTSAMTHILAIGINPTWFGEASNKGYNMGESRSQAEIEASVRKLREDLKSLQNTAFETVQVNPGEPESWKKLVAALKKRKWDGISFGGGLRRHPDLGNYFTEATQVAVRENPKATFLFPLRPDDVYPAIKKYIPQAV